MHSLIDPCEFSIPAGTAYLDTAAEGLPPRAVEAALGAYWQAKSSGSPGRKRLYQEQRELESAAARLLGTSAEHIVPLANASVALNLLAGSVDWQPGDEVLICDLEFPSNVVVWLQLQERGVEVVVVPSTGGVIELEDWLARLTPRTRIVSVSQVSYKTGTQLPYLHELAKHVHDAGALFCVDATQALGRVPVSVDGVDFLVASSYKWLLGTHGLGLVYLAPTLRDRLTAGAAGWYALDEIFHPRRFDSFTTKRNAGQLQAGMPNFPAIFALRAGIECLLRIGIERLDRELQPLVTTLREGLADLGLTVLSPPAEQYASGIVAFACDDPARLASDLAGQGVIVWGGDGRIRASVHLYNTEDDIGRCLAAVRSLSTVSAAGRSK